MSDIRFNQWLHQSGTGGVSQVDGGHVGIGTTNPDIAVHTANTKKINVGIVTANSVYAGAYYGDGSNLTGLASDKIEEGDTKVEVVDSGDQYIVGEVNGSEKIRIDSNGRLFLGTTTEGHPAADDFTIANTANAADMGITLRSADNGQGAIYFSDGTSGADEYRGIINYNHTNNFFSFFTDASERLRIDSSGKIGINRAATEHPLEIGHASSPTQSFWRGSTKGFAISAESAGTYLMSYQNAPLIFSVNSAIGFSERLRIGTSGQLGIAGANYGTNGQVLSSTGSSTGVSWKTPLSVLISSTTVSSEVSSVTFTEALTDAFSTYGIYVVTINGLRFANDDRDLHCRIRTGTNGATQLSSSDYLSMTNGPGADDGFSAASQWRFNYNNIGNEIAGSYIRETFNAVIYFYGFEANKRCRYHGTTTYQSSDGSDRGQFINGTVTDASETTGLQFFSSSGNIALGKFSLFGVNG